MKKYCAFDQKETTWKSEKDTTPQGYPMKIEVCGGCGVRVLTNDPEADYLALHPKKTDESDTEG